jgi:hypothetical protein
MTGSGEVSDFDPFGEGNDIVVAGRNDHGARCRI